MSKDFSLSYLIIKLGVHEHYRILLLFVNRKNYIISIVFFLLLRIIFGVHEHYPT